MTKKTLKELKKILDDKISGSTEIVLRLNDYFHDNANDFKTVIASVEKAKTKLSHFAVIKNYLYDFLKVIQSEDYEEIIEFTKRYKKDIENKYNKLYYNSRKYLSNKNSILSISNSYTLLEIFKRLKKDNKKLKIIIAESRPKNEGRLFAQALTEYNIKVELITDAMISLYIPKIDVVVLGADAILNNGNIINKAGSKSAALLCRYYKKPCYVITTKDKITSKNKFHQVKQNPGEIWDLEDKNIKITNYYFEEIYKNLFTKIITD